MERRFFMTDFEQSLQEHADNFQMAPSKKVWHGIYNDLHPGKRWPSVTMSLLLIFTLVVIGHLNTNNSGRSGYLTNKIPEPKKSALDLKKKGNSTYNQRIVIRKTDLDKGKKVFVYSPGRSANAGLVKGIPIRDHQNNNAREDQLLADNLQPANNPVTFVPGKNLILPPQPTFSNDQSDVTKDIDTKETGVQNDAYSDKTLNAILQGKIDASRGDNFKPTKKITIEKKNSVITDDAPKKETQGAAIKTTKLHKKRNDKVSWVYFGAPVVSSVSFSGKPLKPSTSVSLSPALSGNQRENKVLHNSALGFEAGTQMNYSLSKKLQFTAGAHLTYSGYNIISNEVHPFFATLVLRDPSNGMPYSRSFITHYGDGTGQASVTIRNYSWQASIPVGLQYQFLGNDKVQFNIAGNFEPSLILKSQAYILSSDGKNYVNDPALMRKWNVSSNFGAFVGFSSRKFKWQVGPNVRYQWLSTYIKDYTIKEHLIDYGIRIGISK